MPGADPRTQAVGVGYTPEGLDQNPAYYELLQEAAFKALPEKNLTAWLIKRAHRRYGFVSRQYQHPDQYPDQHSDQHPDQHQETHQPHQPHQPQGPISDPNVASAWAKLGASGYAHDGMVHDGTAVGLTVGKPTFEPWTGFDVDRHTPKPALCQQWHAWGLLIDAAPAVRGTRSSGPRGVSSSGAELSLPAVPASPSSPPASPASPASPALPALPATFTYDLVDVGREVLSQLTIPASLNFSEATDALPFLPTLKGERADEGADEGADDKEAVSTNLRSAGAFYHSLLLDMDSLLSTDHAFLLGTWLDSARRLAGNATDCTDTGLGPKLASGRCDDFMEWNARSQLTTWYPTMHPTDSVPKSGKTCNDYARKQVGREIIKPLCMCCLCVNPSIEPCV